MLVPVAQLKQRDPLKHLIVVLLDPCIHIDLEGTERIAGTQ